MASRRLTCSGRTERARGVDRVKSGMRTRNSHPAWRGKLTAVHHGRGEAAEESGRQIVRMPFHGVGDVEQALGGELIAPQDVGAHGTGHQQCGGGTESPADGNLGFNVNFYAPDLLAEGGQHGAEGGVGHVVRAGVGLVAAGDLQTGVGFFKSNVGVQAQGTAEGVKPGAEVRGGGGNADGNSFHAASPVGLQMQDVVQHVFLVDDAGVALGLALQTSQIFRDGHTRHGGQPRHLVELAAGGIAAHGSENRRGNL